jgi:DNA-directed RNA polymerase sigma subunit (sigma70/sigma32)
VRAQLTSALGDVLSRDDIEQAIARRLDSSPELVREMSRQLDEGELSLDTPMSSRDGAHITLLSFLPDGGADPEAQLGDAERDERVKNIVAGVAARLTPSQRYVLERRVYAEDPETSNPSAASSGSRGSACVKSKSP